MANESQRSGGAIVVAALVSLGAVRRGQQSDRFIITYRLHFHARAHGQLADGQVGAGRGRHFSLNLQSLENAECALGQNRTSP